jgi:putative phosphoribosyl transferase
MATALFKDRREAGQKLAQKIETLGGSVVVFGLPRGGLETASAVANELGVPLSLVITRKIGHPNNPEYAVGAVGESSPAVWNEKEISKLDAGWLKQSEAAERHEAARRRQAYMSGHEQVSARGKLAIIVDDGMATGLTMRAAINEISQQGPNSILVAVPVAPTEVVDSLHGAAYDVITVLDPAEFGGSVGEYYEDFPQLSDQDVLNLLQTANN